MGEENNFEAVFFSINGSNGEMKQLGKGKFNPVDEICEVPKYAKGGIKNKCVGFAEIGEEGFTGELELTVMPKAIKKKRFIKLLMGNGYQRNDAYKMHQKYMENYKSRNLIALSIFLATYNIKPIFKLKVGEKIFEGEIKNVNS